MSWNAFRQPADEYRLVEKYELLSTSPLRPYGSKLIEGGQLIQEGK